MLAADWPNIERDTAAGSPCSARAASRAPRVYFSGQSTLPPRSQDLMNCTLGADDDDVRYSRIVHQYYSYATTTTHTRAHIHIHSRREKRIGTEGRAHISRDTHMHTYTHISTLQSALPMSSSVSTSWRRYTFGRSVAAPRGDASALSLSRSRSLAALSHARVCVYTYAHASSYAAAAALGDDVDTRATILSRVDTRGTGREKQFRAFSLPLQSLARSRQHERKTERRERGGRWR